MRIVNISNMAGMMTMWIAFVASQLNLLEHSSTVGCGFSVMSAVPGCMGCVWATPRGPQKVKHPVVSDASTAADLLCLLRRY